MKKQSLYNKLLACYQIIGGLIGIGLILWILISVHIQFALQYIALFVAMLLYSFSIICGVALTKNKKNSLSHSLINQILQIISFSIGGYGFQYISGFHISFGIELGYTAFLLKYGISSWQIEFNSKSAINEVHINVFSILIIILIERLMKISQIDNVIKLDAETN